MDHELYSELYSNQPKKHKHVLSEVLQSAQLYIWTQKNTHNKCIIMSDFSFFGVDNKDALTGHYLVLINFILAVVKYDHQNIP